MEKEFVPVDESMALEELGFDEPCLGFYDGKGNTTLYFNNLRDASGDFKPFIRNERLTWFGAPTFSQAFRWFREKYNLCGWVQESYFKGLKLHQYHISKAQPLNIISNLSECTYEEAELECLKKLIEIVKDGKK